MLKKDSAFFNPNSNFAFSKLRGLDLQELLVQIDNLYLAYRNTLNLPSELTFGIEIEYEDCERCKTDEFIKKYMKKWKSKTDGSVMSGGEISSPILIDSEEIWKDIKMICHYLKSKNANTLENAGGHIHIGAHILGNNMDNWRKFLKVYAIYENIIFRFVYGDKISARKDIKMYARPIANMLMELMDEINKLDRVVFLEDCFKLTERRQALNFKNIDFYLVDKVIINNTLEFRSPNATIEEVIWQNNINALTKLMLSASLGQIDEEFLNYKLESEPGLRDKKSYMYDEVCLKNALEFVDIVFNNNLDKVYFLKQYIKGFENNYGLTTAYMAKRMVK